MSANAALAPEDGRIKNVSGAALFVKYGPARKRENSERGHARRRSVRAFEHSGQSRSPVCKRTAQMIHIFTPALAIASTIALLQPLSSCALRSSAAFARALSRSPLACGFSDVPF